MPVFKLDRIAEKQLSKLNKKDHEMQGRFEKTKAAFDANHLDPKLDFKKHQSIKGVFKIRLLGKNDGKRMMLRPDTSSQTFYVYDIIKHDDIP